MTKVLILGAGIYQEPLIKKAKEEGYYTIVVSVDGDYPGFKYADKVYYVDTTDKEKVLEISKTEKIDAICTTGTDVAIGTIGYVNDNLGLSGIGYNAAILTNDKLLMKDAFEEYGVKTARYRKVITLEDAEKCFEELNTPLMFKATDTSGSRGIIKVDSISELKEAFEYSFSYTKKDYIIVEEFIKGEEFGAQAAVINGNVTFSMVHGDIVYHGKTDVPIGHFVPYKLENSINDEVCKQIELTVQSLGLDDCAMNFDFILQNNEVYVLEVGARVGATCLAEQVALYYEVDYYKYILDVSLGNKIEVDFVPKRPNASLLFISDKTGVFEKLEVKTDKYNVNEIKIDYSKGDLVNKFEVGPDRIGHIVIESKNRDNTLEEIKELQSNYKIIIR